MAVIRGCDRDRDRDRGRDRGDCACYGVFVMFCGLRLCHGFLSVAVTETEAVTEAVTVGIVHVMEFL